ncbi:hypothetical protein SETIT_3G232400v2 [Setaria italica]|uniref:Uncharacterized protein n=1 Tax=Setaria italica TaxID=4555 RepID=A0A368QI15_SETIT|nr:hypothetical protein SETIT_3G232400v2 [Setaria italica]
MSAAAARTPPRPVAVAPPRPGSVSLPRLARHGKTRAHWRGFACYRESLHLASFFLSLLFSLRHGLLSTFLNARCGCPDESRRLLLIWHRSSLQRRFLFFVVVESARQLTTHGSVFCRPYVPDAASDSNRGV